MQIVASDVLNFHPMHDRKLQVLNIGFNFYQLDNIVKFISENIGLLGIAALAIRFAHEQR